MLWKKVAVRSSSHWQLTKAELASSVISLVNSKPDQMIFERFDSLFSKRKSTSSISPSDKQFKKKQSLFDLLDLL
jgi:hypothetical protein